MQPPNMDWDDDEAPPDLVEVGSNLPEEEKPVKVPITIVTGRPEMCNLPKLKLPCAKLGCRIPRGWKDDPPQLHPHRPTWEKGRCHHER